MKNHMQDDPTHMKLMLSMENSTTFQNRWVSVELLRLLVFRVDDICVCIVSITATKVCTVMSFRNPRIARILSTNKSDAKSLYIDYDAGMTHRDESHSN